MTANAGFTFGVTKDLSLSAALPYVIHAPRGDTHVSGIADPIVQAKWRTWKRFTKGQVDALSLVGALKLPAGADELSPGNAGYVLGVTAARENLRYYLFGTLRYVTQTAGLSGKPGDVFLYDFATGLRPWIGGYEDPDLVILVELNGATSRGARRPAPAMETTEQALVRYRTVTQAHSSGATRFAQSTGEGFTELAVSPQLLLSWRNVMLRSGVQLPFLTTAEGGLQNNLRLRTDLIVQY